MLAVEPVFPAMTESRATGTLTLTTSRETRGSKKAATDTARLAASAAIASASASTASPAAAAASAAAAAVRSDSELSNEGVAALEATINNLNAMWDLRDRRAAAKIFAAIKTAATAVTRSQHCEQEADLQALMTVVHLFCLSFVGSEYVLRDTHLKQGPGGFKPDHCFVADKSHSATPGNTVQWCDIVFVEELKTNLHSETTFNEVLLQAHDRLLLISDAVATFAKNSTCSAIAHVSDGLYSVIYLKTTMLRQLPLMSFLGPSVNPESLRRYLSVLISPLSGRGIVPPRQRLCLSDGSPAVELTLVRAGDVKRSKPNVFSCVNEPNMVVKVFTNPSWHEQERLALELVESTLQNAVPDLRTRYDDAKTQELMRLNPGTYLLITTPRAQSTLNDSKCTAELFVEVAHVAGRALAAMHDKNLCHGDLSPANILVYENGVRINDFGSSCVSGTRIADVNFTPMYAALDVEHGDATYYTPIYDWHALFFVLVAFARQTAAALSRTRPPALTDRVTGFTYPLTRRANFTNMLWREYKKLPAVRPDREPDPEQEESLRALATALHVLVPMHSVLKKHWEKRGDTSEAALCTEVRKILANAAVR